MGRPISTCDGGVGFFLNVKIDAAVMSEWSIDQIEAFFAGIAKMIAAGGEQPVTITGGDAPLVVPAAEGEASNE